MTKDNFNEIMGVTFEEYMTLDPATRDVVLMQAKWRDKEFAQKQQNLEDRKTRMQNQMKERLNQGRGL